MNVPQELLYKNPSHETTRNCDRVYRGIVQHVYHRDLNVTGERIWQTYCDVQLTGIMQPFLRKVPIAIGKSNLRNGEDWAPETGDTVLVQFIDGRVADPVITGFLFPWDGKSTGLQPSVGDVPTDRSRYYRRCNGTSELVDKDGNRIVHVAADETITIVGDGTVTINGSATINVTGDATITAPNVYIEASTKVRMTTPSLEVTGDITAGGDVYDQNGTKSMAGMRTVYNSHTHTDPQGGSTGTPTPTQ